MLSLKRTRERASLFAAVLGVCAIVSGLGVGLLGYLADSETIGAREFLGARSGSDVALEVSMERAADPVRQDEGVREFLADRFRDGDRKIPIAVDRTVAAAATVAFSPAGEEDRDLRATVLSIADFPSRADLVAGDWPTDPTEVSVQADVAERLGVEPGMRATLGNAEVTVVALWRATDALDPRWLSDTLLTAGIGSDIAPVVVDESMWEEIGAVARARWVVVPTLDRVEATDIARLPEVWNRLPTALRADPSVEAMMVDQRGRLVRSAVELQARFDAVRAVAPISLLIIGAVGLVTIVELAGLLATVRSRESFLLWSRGAAPGRLVRWTVLEAAGTGAVGAALGTAVAIATLIALSGDSASLVRAGVAAVIVPVGVVIVAASAFGYRTAASLAELRSAGRPDESGRLRRVGGAGVLVLLVLAAGISLSQLLLYGSPIVPSSRGADQIDPLAVLSPALVLLALVLAAARFAPAIGARLERATARRAGLDRALVLRNITRRVRVTTTPIVLCALAFGQLVIAGSYAQTWDDAYSTTSQLRAGSALRVSTGSESLQPAILAEVRATEGVDAVAPVAVQSVVIGADQTSVVAVDPSALRDLAFDPRGLVGVDATADAITAGIPAVPIAAGARELVVELEVDGVGATRAAALIRDSYGVIETVPLRATAGGEYSAELPDSAAALVGMDVYLAPIPRDSPAPVTVTMTGASADGHELDLAAPGGWAGVSIETWPTLLTPYSETPATLVDFPLPGVRLLPQLVQDFEQPTDAASIVVPIAISERFARGARLEVGEIVPIALDPRSELVSCVIAAVIPAIPGATNERAVLVDLAVLQALRLRTYPRADIPGVVWIDTVDAAATAERLRESLPASVRVQGPSLDPSRDILSAAATALWVGAAGTAVLSLLALGAVVGAQRGPRRAELLVLRALGLRSRQSGGLRRRELALLLATGALIGVVAGGIVVLSIVVIFARAAVPDLLPVLPAVPSIALLPTALGAAALIAALGALAFGYGTLVARDATRVTEREVQS